MLTKSGAKLLDFGLAKQAQSAVSATQAMRTTAAPITAQGTIIGTLQYIAPEQLEGREADARTDIFAFGSVLYEMATGRRAFEGKSQVSLMAAIVDHHPPPVSSLTPVSPRLLDHVVRTCLAKDADARWQSMADVLLQLRLIADAGADPIAAGGASRPSRRSRLGWLAASIAGLVVGAGAALAVMRPSAPPSPPKIQFDVQTPAYGNNNQIALSPTGTHLVAQIAEGGGRLWLRAMDSPTGTALAGTEVAQWPFWSADGRYVAFFAGGKLKRVDTQGAPPQTLADAANGTGGDWNRDNVIIFAPDNNGPLFRVSASGGVAAPLTELDKARGEIAHRHPSFLPDGRHFIYVGVTSPTENSAILVASLDSPKGTLLVNSQVRAAFAAPDLLVFARLADGSRSGTLMAQRFDPGRIELAGDAFAVAEHVGLNSANSAAGFSVSDAGILAYRVASDASLTSLKWLDRQGRASVAVETPAAYRDPALSPDGLQVVVNKLQLGIASPDIWLLDLVRGSSTRLTSDAAFDGGARWSPDGNRIAFASNRSGSLDLYEKSVNGVAPEELLVHSAGNKTVADWSPDGRWLLYTEGDPQTKGDLWVLPLAGERKPEAFLRSPFDEFAGRFSPDGRWVAHEANDSGRDEVYLSAFPKVTTRIHISTSGGHSPAWRRDGKELFYTVEQTPGSSTVAMMAVDIAMAATGTPRVGLPRKLFDVVAPLTDWDVSADGQRFLFNAPAAQSPATVLEPIRVMVNWQRPAAVK